MEHFLGYHSADIGGPYFRDDKSKRASTGKFFTAKTFRPETLIGNKIWVIEGRDKPRQYRIVSTGTITSVISEERPEQYRTSTQEEGLTIEFHVNEFNDPIDVTSFDWFKTLKDSQQNFSYGFTRLTNPTIVKEIEAAWASRGTIDLSPTSIDIENIASDTKSDATTKKRLIDARLGQGRFRDELETKWENTCAVTGCKVSAVLRASHIKPWRHSTNDERLDSNNGLLLAAHIDALFDCGLITFRDDGKMLISKQLGADDIRTLQLGRSLSKRLNGEQKKFLQHHRAVEFQDNKIAVQQS